jgi:hypothetical protein
MGFGHRQRCLEKRDDVTMTRTARFVGRVGDEPDPTEMRARAVDTLREGFRSVGYMLDEATVEHAAAVFIRFTPDGGYVPAPAGREEGFYIDWTGVGNPRITDEAVPVVIVDTGGVAVVPEPVATDGGDMRVRHGYGGEVTVRAFDPAGEPTGYLFAQPLDDDTVHVELFGGTASLLVTRDNE